MTRWPTSGGGSRTTAAWSATAASTTHGATRRSSCSSSPNAARCGVGGFILQRLEQEAGARHLNYIYNVVPTGHPDPETVTRWLTGRGFEATEVGELRKRVPKADVR